MTVTSEYWRTEFPRIATVLRSMNVPLYVLFINRNSKNHRPIDLSIVNGGDASESRMLESVENSVAALESRGGR